MDEPVEVHANQNVNNKKTNKHRALSESAVANLTKIFLIDSNLKYTKFIDLQFQGLMPNLMGQSLF